MKQEEGSDKVVLVGQGMGGLIAIDYGLHFPEEVSAIVGLSPFLSQPNITNPSSSVVTEAIATVFPGYPTDFQIGKGSFTFAN